MGLFKNNFQRRYAEKSEEVYQKIVSGEIRGVDAVEAALWEARLEASTEDKNED